MANPLNSYADYNIPLTSEKATYSSAGLFSRNHQPHKSAKQVIPDVNLNMLKPKKRLHFEPEAAPKHRYLPSELCTKCIFNICSFIDLKKYLTGYDIQPYDHSAEV